MFIKVVFLVTTISHLTNGYPWDSPSVDYNVEDFLSSRIVGGVDAPQGKGNHMMALLGGSIVRFLSCGASIIGKRLVLTAAHCIEPFVIWGELSPQIIGVVGSKYWNSTDTTVTFSGYRNHPGWDWSTIKNDIGVMFTTKDIQFNDRVSPISLSYEHVAGRQRSYVAGWGRIEVWGKIPYHLQLLKVNTISPNECMIRMKLASIIWGPAPPVDPKLEICTFHSEGHGMCNGDSGSALVLEDSGKQIGLVSWGYPCARGAPDVHVRVSAFDYFLLPIIAKHV